MTNRHALPRVYVPERVETVSDDQERLAKLAADDFDPRQVAYVEDGDRSQLPAACRGSAEIVEEIPTRIEVSLDMQTPGLVVLADLWDVGGMPIITEMPSVSCEPIMPCGESWRRREREPSSSATSRPASPGACGFAGWPCWF